MDRTDERKLGREVLERWSIFVGGHPEGKAPPTGQRGQVATCITITATPIAELTRNAIKACDKALIKELRALADDPRKWPLPPRKGTEADSPQLSGRCNLVFQ